MPAQLDSEEDAKRKKEIKGLQDAIKNLEDANLEVPEGRDHHSIKGGGNKAGFPDQVLRSNGPVCLDEVLKSCCTYAASKHNVMQGGFCVLSLSA